MQRKRGIPLEEHNVWIIETIVAVRFLLLKYSQNICVKVIRFALRSFAERDRYRVCWWMLASPSRNLGMYLAIHSSSRAAASGARSGPTEPS